MSSNTFCPIFIVGTPRSGTTMLSTLLDRHSKISFPPETQFFTEFSSKLSDAKVKEYTKNELAQLALANHRIKDLNLNHSKVLKRYLEYPKDLPNLLRAILETYAEQTGKIIPGEKTPKHLEHIPLIIKAFPSAKIICIIRDGRDVVRSLLKVNWAEPNNPRRFGLFCLEWCEHAALTMKYKKLLSADHFITVKYEDIISDPEKTLTSICKFIGVDFEPAQLVYSAKSNVVPHWEKEWKSKSSTILDKNRIAAWRNSKDRCQLWTMNCMMGTMLEKLGYPDTDLKGCPLKIKVKFYFCKLPYLKIIRPFSLLGLKFLRHINLIPSIL
ncbi:MAG: sulfotransferase [Desulfobulbaceae bacterium]|nr:sulfotransferase [Desulfobulbaceae bacterium]